MASHATPEYNRAYYITHQEKVKSRVAQYRATHIESIQEYQQKYYQRTRPQFIQRVSTYKKSRPAWFKSWHSAKARCNNPRNTSYKHYGGRGIKFFLTQDEVKQLAIRDKTDGMQFPTLDRIDVHDHYRFDNCQFMERSDNTAKSWRDCPIRVWRGGK